MGRMRGRNSRPTLPILTIKLNKLEAILELSRRGKYIGIAFQQGKSITLILSDATVGTQEADLATYQKAQALDLGYSIFMERLQDLNQ